MKPEGSLPYLLHPVTRTSLNQFNPVHNRMPLFMICFNARETELKPKACTSMTSSAEVETWRDSAMKLGNIIDYLETQLNYTKETWDVLRLFFPSYS
jgi:hypothetical protein